MKTTLITLMALISILSTPTIAQAGITVYAAEIGIGKFHRLDNKIHPYSPDNVWKHFILPDAPVGQSPYILKNADQSVTIFFSSLEELMRAAAQISGDLGQKIDVLDINAHGMPGGMWFPLDAAQADDFQCADWKDAASKDDQVNYDQYYSPVTKYEIMQIRDMSNHSPGHYGCVTDLPEWQQMVARVPQFSAAFSSNAKIHLASCVVGLGPVGEAYTQGLAQAIFGDSSGATIQSSVKFGLGDWSMPEGMGFWDYLNDAQLDKDNAAYPVDRKDREEMQKGQIRIAANSAGRWGTTLLPERDFMNLGTGDTGPALFDQAKLTFNPQFTSHRNLPSRVRIPGTGVYAAISSD